MIVVNIELWPHGSKDRSKTIGNLVIVNDGTGNVEHGNYNVALSHAGIYYGKKKEPWKTGSVKNHKRMLSPYHLVYKAIKNTLGLR